MSTQQYSNVEVYINGSKLAEAASVKISRTTDAQIVNTLGRGFAGVSPGARMIKVTVENAVPSASFEYDPGSVMETLTPVELTLFAAGKSLSSRGFILEDDFSGAVNSQTQLSFSFTGEWASWT